jgi:hypothetical protein
MRKHRAVGAKKGEPLKRGASKGGDSYAVTGSDTYDKGTTLSSMSFKGENHRSADRWVAAKKVGHHTS